MSEPLEFEDGMWKKIPDEKPDIGGYGAWAAPHNLVSLAPQSQNHSLPLLKSMRMRHFASIPSGGRCNSYQLLARDRPNIMPHWEKRGGKAPPRSTVPSASD